MGSDVAVRSLGGLEVDIDCRRRSKGSEDDMISTLIWGSMVG